MDQVTLQYGGSTLSLAKSTRLIAVKPETGRDRDLAGAAAAVRSQVTGLRLSGFSVTDVAAANLPMEESLNALRADARVATGSHVYHTSGDEVPFVPTGDVYVEFQPKASLRECQRLLDKQSLVLIEARGERSLVMRTTPDSPNPLKVAAALQSSALVAVAEPELATPARACAFSLPSDALLNQQWHLRNTGSINGTTFNLKAGADARVIAAWQRALSLGNRDVIVGVIDDGFDLDHPDLSGPGKIVAPWDFTRNNANPRPGEPYWNPSEQTWVGDWHGTACAGVAVGSAQGSGIVGAAPNCRLMPVRWGVNLADAQVEAWFNHVRTQGAWVVSCSWGAAASVFQLSTRISNAIARCAIEGRNGKGTVICFAAANDNQDINNLAGGSVNGFANHPNVVAVAACTSRDARSHYSNFGAAISLAAPSSGAGGWQILTADVTGTFVGNGQTRDAGYGPGDYTSTFGGTSSATPLVAGIAALVLSVKPELTAVQVKSLLQQTARRIGPASAYNAAGHSTQFGFGCVNALAAVTAIAAPAPPAPAVAAVRKPRVRAARA